MLISSEGPAVSQIGPRPTEMVWLASSFGRVAHSIHGDAGRVYWRSKCGRFIQNTIEDRDGAPRVREYGSCVEWRLLNHEMVTLCRSCFPVNPLTSRAEPGGS